ncbi:Glutamate receptor ionotropic like protein [Argiope bruennichi]|uniref:Glutamate receptor ionotropic like protein n=1 Tax=Argiope bruennichi TaxID=94029 RepID=A0A8T0FRD9_ARGBR|nr:Glutamate receptor ionotropic like protein [Argiope bruennichi]
MLFRVIVVLSALVVETLALPKLIRIGGIFDTEDEEQELAFRLAVEFFNRDTIMRRKPALVAQVERINTGDIYDANKKGIIRLQNFLKEAEKNKWGVRLYSLDDSIPYRKVFWNLKKDFHNLKVDNKIVLDVGREILFDVLKQAQQVGMMTENQQYLITSLDFHTIDLSDFKYAKCNLTGFRLVQDSYNDYHQLIESMARRPYNYRKGLTHGIRAKTALMFDAVHLFISALEQLDVGKEVEEFPTISCFGGVKKGTDGTSLINYMKSSNILGITGGITFNGQGVRSMFQLDLMHLTEEGLVKMGEMLPGQIVNITRYVGLEDSSTQRTLIVTTIKDKPHVMLVNSTRKLHGNDQYEGFCIDLIEELSKILNFKYEIRLVKDEEFGKEKNGMWTGVIGEVMQGKADMAVAGLSINSKREKAVDFTLPFMNTGISILYQKPTTQVSIVTFLVGRLTPYEWINPHPCRQDDIVVENTFNLRNSFWFNIGSIMQQGSDLIPTAFSTRTAASFWNFFTLIMVSSYTANLAAFLTVERAIYPFNSAMELAKQKKIKYGCVDSGTTRAFFEDSKIPLYAEMWEAMKSDPTNLVKSSDMGKKKVKQGNYAFFMESASIEYLSERECDLTQIGGLLDSKGYGIATKKGNRELSARLSAGILKLQEEGVLHTLKNKWWKQKDGGKCTVKQSNTVRELTLGNVGGVFVVLIFGLGVSIVVAFIEFRWKTFQWENPNKDSFWTLLKNEIKFTLSFDQQTKPVPQLKKKKSSTTDNSRSSMQSRGTHRSGS